MSYVALIYVLSHPMLATGGAASQPAVWKQPKDVGKGALGGEKNPSNTS